MTKTLQRALEEQKRSTQQEILKFTGILGIPLGGSRVVEVPTRKGYVYVRLRDNPNEVIQAFNNQVAPSYNLPVIVERINNKYIVSGIDTERYENNWNSYSPYLPRHGNAHSFDIESGGGGDIVWVYPKQFMPLLVFPSGSLGAPNVLVAPYTLRKDNSSWLYVGNTGTQSFAPYRPTSPTGAVMGLVYLNTNDGNPYIFINSGTVFSNSLTGSSQIYSYIPQITSPSTQIPLAAIRLITGTSQISWDNIYDVRQFLHNTPTGTGGGEGTINTGTLNSLYLRLDATNDPVTGPLTINVTNAPSDNNALRITSNDPFNSPGAAYFEAHQSDALVLVAHQTVDPLLIFQEVSGTITGNSILSAQRYATPTGATFLGPALLIEDFNEGGAFFYGGFAEHLYSGTTIFRANPQATGTIIPYIFNTQYPKPTGTILASWQVQGSEKARVDVSGTFYSNNQPLIKEALVNNISYARRNAGWSASPLYLPFCSYDSVASMMTVDGSNPFVAVVDRTVSFVNWAQGARVSTTNNGTHYWRIQLLRLSDAAVINEINTSAISADTWSLITDNTFSIADVGTSNVGCYVHLLKNGSPGALSLSFPLIEVTM